MDMHSVFAECQRLLTSGDARGCVNAIARAFDAGLSSDLLLLTRAVAHMRLKEYAEAIKDCNAALPRNVENERIYYYRGSACRMMKKYAEAIANFNEALAIKPDFGLVYLERALCYLESGQEKEAEHDFKLALSFSELALQQFADAMGMIRTHFDEMEALLYGEREIPRLDLPPKEVEQWLQSVH